MMASNAIEVLMNPESTPTERMEVIKDLTEQRLRALIKRSEIPAELEYIVTEVSLSRFNRIGLEGVSKYTQEGLTEEFSSDDFEPYLGDINNWLDENSQPKRSKWTVFRT